MVVEDELFVGLQLVAELESGGHDVHGPFESEERAAGQLDAGAVDCVLLDANLNGHHPRALAERLIREDIPFAYLSGYGADFIARNLPPGPLIGKPYRWAEIERFLDGLTH
jgi:CheY-like chemotaxis protein